MLSFFIMKENQFNRNNLLKKQLEREKKLFDKKWKILERELRRLAEEKKRLEREKQMYQEVKKVQAVGTVNGEVFFNGVNNSLVSFTLYRILDIPLPLACSLVS